MTIRKCTLTRCNEKHAGLGYCKKHYNCFKRTGFPMNKLELLEKYCDIQADDKQLWVDVVTEREKYFQQELRRITWLIEDADMDKIIVEIERLKARLGINK